jgi:hypothetical protein
MKYKFILASCTVMILMHSVILDKINIVEKCINTNTTDYVMNELDFIWQTFNINESTRGFTTLTVGQTVQVYSEMIILNEIGKSIENKTSTILKLVKNGNMTVNDINFPFRFIPLEHKKECSHKLRCSKNEAKLLRCDQCRVGGENKNMTECRKAILNNKEDYPIFNNDLCPEQNMVQVPNNFSFYVHENHTDWTYGIISKQDLWVIDKGYVGECPSYSHNFVCVDIEDQVPIFTFDENSNIIKKGEVTLYDIRDSLYENDYLRVKFLSPGEIEIHKKRYFIVHDPNMFWINENLLIDCNQLEPGQTHKHSPHIKPDDGDLIDQPISIGVLLITIIICIFIVILIIERFLWVNNKVKINKNDELTFADGFVSVVSGLEF